MLGITGLLRDNYYGRRLGIRVRRRVRRRRLATDAFWCRAAAARLVVERFPTAGNHRAAARLVIHDASDDVAAVHLVG